MIRIIRKCEGLSRETMSRSYRERIGDIHQCMICSPLPIAVVFLQILADTVSSRMLLRLDHKRKH